MTTCSAACVRRDISSARTDRDDVGAGHLADGDLLLVRSVEIDVVRADTGRSAELEVLGRGDELASDVAGLCMSHRAESIARTWNGVVMMTSASLACWDSSEFGPSLSSVTTSSWPCSLIQSRRPRAFSVVP